MATQLRGSRRNDEPPDEDGAERRSRRRRHAGGATHHWRVLVLVLGAVLTVVGVVILIWEPFSGSQTGSDRLLIYSSLPQRERLQSASARSSRDEVVKNERTMDMQNAMGLALAQAGGKAGEFDVSYKPLDDSDARGESPAGVVQANAQRAKADDDTAVYIGDFTSDATQQSLPILSVARVPQISVSSTRVGLTRRDPETGDSDEPGRYYPPQPGYPSGFRNFVRLIPTTAVHARAMLAVLAQQDHCQKVAMINDDSSYGEALAEDIRAKNHHRVSFMYDESVGPNESFMSRVEQARRAKADCFVYSGIRNPNTVEIFTAFAQRLPAAKLYGTNGVVTASFADPRKGLPPNVAARVKVMVPPYDRSSADGFFDAFRKTHDKTADTYALYAYEAMRLALDAIERSGSGDREDIVRELFRTADRAQSALGSYSITPTGDTNVASYGVSRIVSGKLTTPRTAPALRRRSR